MAVLESKAAPPDYIYHEGDAPVVLTLPHVGTHIPRDIAEDMTLEGREMPDNDQHLETLWRFAREKGVTTLQGNWCRYVVDLNRDPDGRELYEGMQNTELCPLLRYDNHRIYNTAADPDAREITHRIPRYWQPFHARLIAALAKKRKKHGYVILLDAHAVKSEIPRLFEGRLPDINIGTNDGRSADPALADALMACLHRRGDQYSSILNGRFIGGFITRHYGVPAAQIHAVQILLAKKIYMQEAPPYALHAGLAERLQPFLEEFLDTALAWRPEQQKD